MKVLLITPPFVQVNTPYPGTQFLAGYLKKLDIPVTQRDLGIQVALKLFSREGLLRIKERLLNAQKNIQQQDSVAFFLNAFSDYADTIEPVVQFLQGKSQTLAHRLANRTLVPEGPRFAQLDQDDLQWAFGTMGVHDRAKHIASLYLDDLVDVVRIGVDSEFNLSKYGEKLAASNPDFSPLNQALNDDRESPILDWIESETLAVVNEVQPTVVGFSIPFPGCLYGALRAARVIRKSFPSIKIALGGGYVNTELRSLQDPRIFNYCDALFLDDGEKPFELWLSKLQSGTGPLLRTLVIKDGKVFLETCATEHDVPQNQTGIPTTEGIQFGQYLSLVEVLNPMQRFWSDLQWNKIMLAHGCYWRKCNFCDISLDYIKRYDASGVDLTVQRMKSLVSENGIAGFHFIDEAAPPAVLRELSDKLIAEGLKYSWWGNIRFDKVFSAELTEKMADAGCVAVSGGLEVASDRLLKKMNKGVTVEQVARVTRNFRKSKILVHAYLMFGFPSQTLEETVESLERVRQLFLHDCINSAFWHRFSATAHSPVGLKPEEFGVTIHETETSFARNDLPFSDSVNCNHDALGLGLRRAVYNYMHGIGLDQDVRTWFEPEVQQGLLPKKLPKPNVSKDLIRDAIKG